MSNCIHIVKEEEGFPFRMIQADEHVFYLIKDILAKNKKKNYETIETGIVHLHPSSQLNIRPWEASIRFKA